MKKLSANQKAFNTVVRKLLKQNKKSLDDNGNCVYRGQGGLRCAAGHLIPNRLYKPSLENQTCSYSGSAVNHILTQLGYDPMFVNELQLLHDCNESGDWKTQFQFIANQYNLTWPEGVPQ